MAGCIVALLGAAAPAAATTANGSFKVKITITAACTVTAGTASDIDLNTHAATDTNVSGSNTIRVNCSKTTPYNIGLAPSNASTAGAGEMAGTGANPDKVPYQLRQASGMAGAVWGNTATASTTGNGVAGTGSGSDQTYTVYATVANTNYTPDSYADTVTVNVYF
jgi:spore coat protein U-like protein